MGRLFFVIVVIVLLQNSGNASAQTTDDSVVMSLEAWLKSHELTDAALTDLSAQPWDFGQRD